MPGQAEHESLVDRLRQLRSEMKALYDIVEKAKLGGTTNDEVISQHRHRLAELRTELQELLPQVLHVRDQCAAAAQGLRSRAAHIRDAIQTVAQQAKVGQISPDVARQRANEHQARFQHLWSQLEELEHRVAFLHEFLPVAKRGTVSSEAITAPLPEAASSAGRPPVQAPLRKPAAQSTTPEQSPEPAAAEDTDIEDDLALLLAPDEVEEQPADDPLIEKSRSVYKKTARDRRIFPRVPFTAEMRYKSSGLSITARSADVSLGGMFVETPSTVPAGQPLSVLFCAEGFPVEIDAVVVYDTPGVGMGLKFGRVHEEDRVYLEALIKRIKAG